MVQQAKALKTKKTEIDAIFILFFSPIRQCGKKPVLFVPPSFFGGASWLFAELNWRQLGPRASNFTYPYPMS
jgi:hypothetical protein